MITHINGRNYQKLVEKAILPADPFPSLGRVAPFCYLDGAGHGAPG
jgi:hypothetical protein